MSNYPKILILLLIPFIYGFIYNSFLWSVVHPNLNQIVFTIFWFWVGIKFACLNGNNIKNFFIGNSVWLLSFLLFLWQFIILDGESRNILVAGISQNYILPFIWIGTKICLYFTTNFLDGTLIIISSFLFMLAVFTIGFIVGKLKNIILKEIK